MNNKKAENRLFKDTYFLFERLNFDVYLESENRSEILLALPRCTKCGTPWRFDISQCFFCGSINSFLIKDENNNYVSATNASQKMRRYYPCINEKCLSNEKDVEKMIKSKYNGVFDRKSPFNTTLENCLKCGNDSYLYDTALIKIYVIDDPMQNINYDKKYDGIILRLYKQKMIKFLIQNPENKLLTIFKFADKTVMNEIEFKSEIEKLIQNPEAFSYTP